MKLKSLMNRFAAISFAALMALGCGLEKPVTPDEPEEKDPTQTEGTSIADVLKAEVGGTFELDSPHELCLQYHNQCACKKEYGSYKSLPSERFT